MSHLRTSSLLTWIVFQSLGWLCFVPLGNAAQPLGAYYSEDARQVRFHVYAPHATRLEAWLYAASFGEPEKARIRLEQNIESGIWTTSVEVAALVEAGITGTLYYGYRAWGPNWNDDPTWTPGSRTGFVADVDRAGHRFNPNKLLLDPYAREVSHDPSNPRHEDERVYASGEWEGTECRVLDSGPFAPKGIVLLPDRTDTGPKPQHPFRDEIIYEVHLRGLTRNDPDVPEHERGTYRGAARKAPYLRELGITAVEFLPVQETCNEQNDIRQGTEWDNYWGYSTLNYFAPDRRYACDQSPGGPTREFKEMVRAFHDVGIKVYLDVVYNHTGEGGLWGNNPAVANLLSWRGLDNAVYYQLTPDADGNMVYYWDNTGVHGNFHVAHPVVRDLIIDSLRYWTDEMGVDGFRFDLASVLGNPCHHSCFAFDRNDPRNVLNRLVHELPARRPDGGQGVDLIAEPWAIGEGTYQLGNFPRGWAEWNDRFRDTVRRDQNRMGTEAVTPGALAVRFAGSSDLYEDDGRGPWASVNFLTAHDGMTLRDLYSYNSKQNQQPWPRGPSDGGTDNDLAWDQHGDPAAQQQAARTGLSLLLLSAGVPMLLGGDEMYRTQFGNNNAYNLDSTATWLDWTDRERYAGFHRYARGLIAFRRAHAALRPVRFFAGKDHNGDGRKDLTWYTDAGNEMTPQYFDNPDNHFIGWLFDGTEMGDTTSALFVAYNGWRETLPVHLPRPAAGRTWHLAVDSSSNHRPDGFVAEATGDVQPLPAPTFAVAARSVAVFVEQ